MDIANLYSIITTWMALCGSFFLSIGVIKLNPKLIVKLSQVYYGLHFDQVDNLSSQKADFLCGIIFIMIAFIMQITNYIVDMKLLEKYLLNWSSYIYLIVIHILPFLFLLLRDWFARIYQKQTIESFCRDDIVYYFNSLKKQPQKRKAPFTQLESVIYYAEDYMEITKKNNESNKDFIIRYARILKVPIPPYVDLDNVT